MCRFADIRDSLDRLSSVYDESILSDDLYLPIYYSKLATIELCGWIEDSFDEVYKKSIQGELITEKYREKVSDKIRNVFGFSYKRHFLPTIVYMKGIVFCEQIDNYLRSDDKYEVFINSLDSVNEKRNLAAHTYVKQLGFTNSFDTPSILKEHYRCIAPFIVKILSYLEELNS
jgi:hypothetical protein